MIGAFASRAASSAATAVEEEVTLMAGIANFLSFAYLKRFNTSSPLRLIRLNIQNSEVYIHDNTSLSPQDFSSTHFV
jgi:hypothetical protein